VRTFWISCAVIFTSPPLLPFLQVTNEDQAVERPRLQPDSGHEYLSARVLSSAKAMRMSC